jgi:Uma2 family endonuclease
MRLIIELPAREEQIAFNRRRWTELMMDRSLADLPNKIETNAYGQILMNPPPTGDHSYRQGEITHHLRRLLDGFALPECPISTIDGVKAADVGWYSDSRFESVRGQDAFETAAEICVEVLSPSNTRPEMNQKRELYFEAGALEVWFCTADGDMEFYEAEQPDKSQATSVICPEFPQRFS